MVCDPGACGLCAGGPAADDRRLQGRRVQAVCKRAAGNGNAGPQLSGCGNEGSAHDALLPGGREHHCRSADRHQKERRHDRPSEDHRLLQRGQGGRRGDHRAAGQDHGTGRLGGEEDALLLRHRLLYHKVPSECRAASQEADAPV